MATFWKRERWQSIRKGPPQSVSIEDAPASIAAAGAPTGRVR
jgi:hypothetical protein